MTSHRCLFKAIAATFTACGVIYIITICSSSQFTPIATLRNDEGYKYNYYNNKVNCFYGNNNILRCVQHLHDADNIILPGFIGIGPSKTGSSALINTIGQHPSVVIGLAANLGGKCCGSGELYYFLRDDWINQGLAFYSKAFNKSTNISKLAAEKTPTYSNHPLVPYRIKSMLTEPKIIMGIRNSTEALVSLYLHRMRNRKQKTKVSSFVEWVRPKLKQYYKYEECCIEKYKELFISNNDNFNNTYFPGSIIRSLFNKNLMSYETTMLLDHYFYQMCWRPYCALDVVGDSIGHYDYITMLKRWKYVFPSSVRCVFHHELIDSEKKKDIIVDLLEFLQLDVTLMPKDTFSFNMKRQFTSSLDTLYNQEGAITNITEHNQIITELLNIYKENTMQIIRGICNQHFTRKTK